VQLGIPLDLETGFAVLLPLLIGGRLLRPGRPPGRDWPTTVMYPDRLFRRWPGPGPRRDGRAARRLRLRPHDPAFEHNRVWLELSLIAQELLAWLRLLCLDGELALAGPKRLRLLHVAGRVVRSARRTTLRLPRSWPWVEALVAAFARLRSLPAGASP
jgi:hypothetical protein